MTMHGRDAWPAGSLRSPVSGLPLQPRGRGVLACAGEAWPVIDGIAFLRADRRDMAHAAVELIEAGDIPGATALLLTDQDPYAPEPPPDLDACIRLVADEDCSFRDAMRRLGFGRVADYFAHRWSDPTFLSGLALLRETLDGNGGAVFELACGAGHFLRALSLAGIKAAGGDIVFAKLWLARRFVCPGMPLVCFNAAAPWPLGEGGFTTALCHDAFYFLPDKTAVAARLRRLVAPGGRVAVGHAHNADADNHSSGEPLTVAGYAALFPGARLFDDRELTRAFADDRRPVAMPAEALQTSAAVSLTWTTRTSAADEPVGPASRRFGTETAGLELRLNPLYRRGTGGAVIAWPTLRYEQEYAALATYPLHWEGPDRLDDDGSETAARLFRQRVYVDLPPRW